MQINYESWDENAEPGIEQYIALMRAGLPDVLGAATRAATRSLLFSYWVGPPIFSLVFALMLAGKGVPLVWCLVIAGLPGILLALAFRAKFASDYLQAREDVVGRWTMHYQEMYLALRDTSLGQLLLSEDLWQELLHPRGELNRWMSLVRPPKSLEEHLEYTAALFGAIQQHMQGSDAVDSRLITAGLGILFGGRGADAPWYTTTLPYYARLSALLDFFGSGEPGSAQLLGWVENLKLLQARENERAAKLRQ